MQAAPGQPQQLPTEEEPAGGDGTSGDPAEEDVEEAAAVQTQGEEGEKAKLVRHSTAVVLAPAQVFWHKDCLQRCCCLVCLFLLLAVVGTLLAFTVSPLLGSAALSMGPAAIVMWVFYKRYQCSTTKAQLAFTFCEAIGWMLALFVVIAFVDPWNNHLTGVPERIHCSWDQDAGGKILVNALSFAAHCQPGNPFEPDGPIIRGHWDGASCEEAPLGMGEGDLALPFAGLNGSGGLVPPALAALEEAAVDAANNASRGKGGRNATSCAALQEGLQDALGEVHIVSLALGDRSVEVHGRRDLASAFDELFGRRVNFPVGCECKKRLRVGEAVPAYDFCGEDGSCLLDYAPPGCILPEGHCTPGPSGNVTAELRYTRKTVLNAFVTAYFRAAFLEELLKYVAVRRILFKDRVADPGGILVYGLAAAAGFATAENVQYTLAHGVFVTYMRMVTAVPLHCCTGLMIGIHLGYRKFLGWGRTCLDKCLLALAVPVLVHGSYDFILMLPMAVPIDMGTRTLIALAIMIAGFVTCRLMWLRMDNVCVVHVKELQRVGRVSKPQCCCCECDCCCAWCQQEDPLLSPTGQERAAPATPRSLSRGSSDASEGDNAGLFRSFSTQLVPEAPDCQTREETCPGCGETVRVHVLFPSDCPFCGHGFPDPRSPESPA